MIRILLIVLIIMSSNINILFAQSIDLSSVDEFFKISSELKEGKVISALQWKEFDNSLGYKEFAESKNKALINIIKSSINIVFGHGSIAEKDSILSITQEEMNSNTKMLLKNHILVNYLDVNNNCNSIKLFREDYDFKALVENAKQRLGSFLRMPIDTTFEFKPVYFLFIDADGGVREDALYVDFNLIYKLTEEKRVNFLAHEFFHNYREKFENHDFNYKSDLNHCIDFIQNEGIADLLDKSAGYEKYFTEKGESPEMVKTWVNLYNQAREDLEKLQNVIIKYSKDEITENEMVDEIIEIVKFNGHPIGFFMANQIVRAGYENEMLKTFYNPYEFFNLYNRAAKELNLFQLNDEFMDYLKNLTKGYYR